MRRRPADNQTVEQLTAVAEALLRARPECVRDIHQRRSDYCREPGILSSMVCGHLRQSADNQMRVWSLPTALNAQADQAAAWRRASGAERDAAVVYACHQIAADPA